MILILCLQNRKSMSKYKSGGIAVAVRTNISKHIRKINTDCKLVLWFTISKNLTGLSDDVLCGAVYIPPVRTKYSVNDPYLRITTRIKRHFPQNISIFY